MQHIDLLKFDVLDPSTATLVGSVAINALGMHYTLHGSPMHAAELRGVVQVKRDDQTIGEGTWDGQALRANVDAELAAKLEHGLRVGEEHRARMHGGR